MKPIEEYIFEDSLPVNTLAMAERLKEILKNQQTNSILGLKIKNYGNNLEPEEKEAFERFKSCLWLINQQVYGQLGKIDLYEEWSKLEKAARNWNKS